MKYTIYAMALVLGVLLGATFHEAYDAYQARQERIERDHDAIYTHVRQYLSRYDDRMLILESRQQELEERIGRFVGAAE